MFTFFVGINRHQVVVMSTCGIFRGEVTSAACFIRWHHPHTWAGGPAAVPTPLQRTKMPPPSPWKSNAFSKAANCDQYGLQRHTKQTVKSLGGCYGNPTILWPLNSKIESVQPQVRMQVCAEFDKNTKMHSRQNDRIWLQGDLFSANQTQPSLAGFDLRFLFCSLVWLTRGCSDLDLKNLICSSLRTEWIFM